MRGGGGGEGEALRGFEIGARGEGGCRGLGLGRGCFVEVDGDGEAFPERGVADCGHSRARKSSDFAVEVIFGQRVFRRARVWNGEVCRVIVWPGMLSLSWEMR